MSSVLRQTHGLFQSQFSTVCDLAISLSISSIFLLLYVNQWLLTSPPSSSCPFYLYFSKCFRRQFLRKKRPIYLASRGSSVGIATRYGMEGPGMRSRWGRDFPHSSRTALGPTQPPIQWVPGLSRGKAASAWR